MPAEDVRVGATTRPHVRTQGASKQICGFLHDADLRRVSLRLVVSSLVFAAFTVAPSLRLSAESNAEPEPDSLRLRPDDAEVLLGDRLFFETRFAQYFFAHNGGDVNAALTRGDDLVDVTPVASGSSLPGIRRGQSMSCRQCHIGDDFVRNRPLAGRTYADFSRRSPIPPRGDMLVTTPRNSPSMVSLGLPREVPHLLHFDGEFVTAEDLTIDSFTGRNFGWLPQESAIATAHLARIIREDEGTNPRYVISGPDRRGVPYRVVMLGTDATLPSYLRLPQRYRIDVMTASDKQVLEAIGRLVHAYMDSIRFGTHNTFRDAASPYDKFLEKNRLPVGPDNGESNLQYSKRLLDIVEQRHSFKWVRPNRDGSFQLHDQPYRFGTAELAGLKIFLTRAGRGESQHVGNCVMCHTPPQFTDQRMHNNGVSQTEYDGIFGSGAFAALDIPDLAQRNANFDDYLPPSPNHPRAKGRFRSPPALDKPGYADLGAWNTFANPDLPKPQRALTEILCGRQPCTPEAVLPLTIAMFKTASVRDLGQSNPYFHSGAVDTIPDALHFYITTARLARRGELRNASPEIAGIRLAERDVVLLSAFLRSLNEDYH